MTDWQERYARRDWDWLDEWWRSFNDRDAASTLLDRLRLDVPKRTHRNGMEAQEEYVTPQEAPAEWKGAAEILYLGELAAWVEGEPRPMPVEWQQERARIEELLHALVAAEEVTKGDRSLSRRAHAQEALKALAGIDWCTNAMSIEADPDGSRPEDRAWLIAFSREIAFLAFSAGAHARAAIGKQAEAHAVRGDKVLSAAKSGGEQRRRQTRPATELTLRRMRELIGNGHTQSRAAELAYEEGLGPSANANRQLLKRHKEER